VLTAGGGERPDAELRRCLRGSPGHSQRPVRPGHVPRYYAHMITRSGRRGSLAAAQTLHGSGPQRNAAAEEAPPRDELLELADVFGLLSDPGRLRVLAALCEGERCVGDLAEIAGASASGTSHHLRLLRAHRVVQAHRSGRMVYYQIADAHVKVLLDVALAHVGHAPAIAHPECEARSR
jgi:DNA-binding transcriptional ArsR family regulator